VEEQKTPKLTEKFKDKKVVGSVIAILVLILVFGGIFAAINSGEDKKSSSGSLISTSDLPELQPSDIGMVVTVRDDGRALMFELTKADDIKTVEYTIEYEKEIDGERVPEGIFGIMNIGEDGITKTDFREFGTCSSERCRYDEVVSDITIILKVTKKDGKEYQVKEKVQL